MGRPVVVKICPHCDREHTTTYKTCKRCYYRISRYGSPFNLSPRWGEGVTEEERFWSKVDVRSVDECWNWTRSMSNYGCAYYQGKSVSSHRLAWQLANGRPPQDGMMILHSCDNKKCCNPNHLREGTCKENIIEARDRGLSPRGEARHNAKLTESQVREIKRLIQSGVPQRVIGNMYGVSKTSIGYIHRGKSWTFVEANY